MKIARQDGGFAGHRTRLARALAFALVITAAHWYSTHNLYTPVEAGILFVLFYLFTWMCELIRRRASR